ncbi:conserved protein of unknown function [Candidatus Filomicrobium marinum]|uniref:Uncharacterized protein n=1 Tax=Candidatus Filomicrobium marinum TaxID=1608628 RepID=A0A0D6JK90_9HYPH|nr:MULTISPECIES: hypothetical protein [Filomicrobium]MCV0370751.1 hypothetical protein [Filomicrobium sp.]CFX30091.1 conserved protein of unknown function [Candidatus Filomicrobium marinum]CPR22107.1 conserved protein of unknown function [Candidatus Filomicrobium marinum]
MIITHTVNHQGKHRVYLGGNFSLKAWLEQKDDTPAWTFAFDASEAPAHMSDPDAMRQWAYGLLSELAKALHVQLRDLMTVPFDVIAKLHTTSALHDKRIPSPQREVIETGYMPTLPGLKRTKADFTASDFKAYHDKGRSRGKR